MMKMEATASHQSNTSALRKLVGRLRGSSISAPSPPPRDEGDVRNVSRAPSFRIGTPRLGRLSESQHPSMKKHNSRKGQQPHDAHISLELWNSAYDALRDDPSCTGLVITYENIISQELPDHLKMGGMNSSFRGKSSDERLDLLVAITEAGLEKRRGSKASQADDVAKLLLDSARAEVETVFADYTAAAVAWTGFCTLTPLLLDPIVQRSHFRSGLIHVVGRIQWYMHLAQLPLGGSWEANHQLQDEQKKIREKLVKLYRKVLELEMNCVCATASSWNAAAKNVVKWNTLDNLISTICDLDEEVAQTVRQNCHSRAKESLLERFKDLDLSASTGNETRKLSSA